MLRRREDYAHQQPSLTKKKLRRLELTAGAPKYAKTARGTWSTNDAIRQAERELAQQAEASYRRMVKDRQAAAPARKVARARHRSAHEVGPSNGAKPRGRLKAPDACASLRQSPAPRAQPTRTQPRPASRPTSGCPKYRRNRAHPHQPAGPSAGDRPTSELTSPALRDVRSLKLSAGLDFHRSRKARAERQL